MDDSFGPRLLGHFDFTLLFEDIFFHVIPSAIVIFSVPYYIHKIFSGTAIVRSGILLWTKLLVAAGLIGLQIANAVYWSKAPVHSRLSSGAAIVQCIGAFCIAIVVFCGHMFFLRAPSLIGLWLTITMIFDITTTLTYFNRTGLDSIARLHIPIPVLKFVLICLEELSKKSLIRSEALRTSLGQEAVAGFWNRSLLFWVNSVLLVGFRDTITQDSLPRLTPQFDSENLFQDFDTQWKKCNRASKYALLKTCLYTMPWPFFYIILPRLLAIGFEFGQPFLLQDVVNAVSAEEETPLNVRRGLIIATAAIYFGRTVSKSWYMHIQNQIVTGLRGALIAAIYHKSLKLSSDDLDASAAVTLMTADVSGVEDLVSLSYDTWARFLEMCCGVALLGAFIGAATIFTVIPVVLATVVSTRVARRLMRTRKNWNGRIQSRIAATSNILAQIKDVKMLGLAHLFAQRLENLFHEEVDVQMQARKYQSETLGISSFAEAMTPVFVVAATLFWTRAAETVTAARLFTTLALISLVTTPLYFLIHSMGGWSGGFACVSRIQKYLNLPESEDQRTITVLDTTGNENASSSVVSRFTSASNLVVHVVHVQRISVCMDLSGSILTDVSMTVAMGGVTMVLGPVGSGKSTLMRAILGEAKLRCGSITVTARSIAYCSQVPWIFNDTIQNNILCGKPYNAILYQRVMYVCALDVDVARLPQREQTMAGSDGFNLSGGQKQRISLARALYSEADLIIMDDVLSPLDTETSSTIRVRLFSETDILESGTTTVIMATSMRQHLVDADVAYELDEEGRIDLFENREHQREQERQRNAQQQSQQQSQQAQPAPTNVAPAAATAQSIEGGGSATTDDSQYEPPKVKPAPDTSARDNVSKTKYGDWSLYKYFFGPAGASGILFWLTTYAITATIDRMPPIYMRLWLDHDSQNRLYFIGYALLGGITPFFYYIAPIVFYRTIVVKTAPSLHHTILDTTVNASFEFLADEDAGDLLNRFSQDITMATQRLPPSITPVIWGFFSILIDVTVIASGATYALPIIPFFLLVVLFLQHFYLYTSRQLRLMELDSSKLVVRLVTESGAGIAHIRAFKWQANFVRQLYIALDKSQKPFYYLLAVQQWLASVLGLTTAGAAVVVVSFALTYRNSTSPSAMGLAMLSLISFSEFTGITVQFFVSMENTFGAVARIRDFARNTPTEQDAEGCEDVPEHWPVAGRVELNCVSAVYKPNTEKSHIALENVTVAVEPGQTLGLVGRTGSGKTSVLLALLHLMEYTGSIYMDGRELRTIPRQVLRTRITTITQAGVILAAPVRFNIDPFGFASRPGGFPTDATLAGILRRVGLWDHVIARGGLDAEMKAMKFSVGQRQLFQLARAILHKQVMRSNIVLMDECTASMDEETERHVYRLIREVFAGCTKIFISHREAMLADADLVLKLEDGRGEIYQPQRGGPAGRPQQT